jgi:Nucleotidyl transferase AbiEii toxin, Type IV TA system
MKRIAAAIEHGAPGAKVNTSAPKGEKGITKLIVRGDGAQIKIEVTPVLRGCVYEPEVRSVSARVEEEFGFAEMSVVSFPDLYGGIPSVSNKPKDIPSRSYLATLPLPCNGLVGQFIKLSEYEVGHFS